MSARGVRVILFGIGFLAILAGCGNFSLSGILDTPPDGPVGPRTLTIAPDTVNAVTGTNVQFSAAGGAGGYTWGADIGSITLGGLYTVPAAVGTYTVTVTDFEGTSQDATVIASSAIPLTISPTSITIDAGGSAAFTGNGGSGTYTWAKTAGLGSMAGSTYNAPWATTTATVQLTDTITTEVRTATVTVRAPTAPQINPTSANLAAGGSITFSTVGGSGAYSYSWSGDGSMAGAAYTADWASGSATVTVTDTNTGLAASAPVTVNAPTPPVINPSGTIDIITGDVIVFGASGGSGAYSWSKDAGPGTLVGSTYTADGGAGTVHVTVTDTNTMLTAGATVNVAAPLVLTISPKAVTLNAGGSVAFTNSATTPPYTYTKTAGAGTLAGQTYTAPWSATTAVIRVTDSDAVPATDDATVTVLPPPALAITPATATVNVGQAVTFSGSGGSGNPLNYTYTKISGGGTLVGAVYTAPGSATTAVIRLTDSLTSQTRDATVTVNPPPALTLSPATVNVLAGSAVTFTPGGGSGSYSFSVVTGTGSLAGYTYTTVGEETATLRLTDTITSGTKNATVTAYYPLTIIPTDVALFTDDTYSFGASGGVPGYTWSVVEGAAGGSVTAAGLYTAPGVPGGPWHVKVVDAIGNESIAAVTISAPAGWDITSIDQLGRSGQFASLALDAAGKPRISYYESQAKELRFATGDGSTWQHVVVDSARSVGKYSSLALEPVTGNARISYFDEKNGELQHARWNGTGWDLQAVDTAGTVGLYSSIALRPGTAYPAVSYYNTQANDLKYAAWNGSAWVTETVDSAGDVGQDTSLAFDASGNPHIAYYDFTNKDLKYASWNGTAWVVETVDSAGDVGQHASLALEPATGYPRIASYDFTNKNLKYAQWDGSAWVITTADNSVNDVGQYASLALEPGTKYPRVAYYDFTLKDLLYAAWDGSAWIIETVDSGGDVGKFASLRLDPSTGKPRIAYYNATAQDLKYAARP